MNNNDNNNSTSSSKRLSKRASSYQFGGSKSNIISIDSDDNENDSTINDSIVDDSIMDDDDDNDDMQVIKAVNKKPVPKMTSASKVPQPNSSISNSNSNRNNNTISSCTTASEQRNKKRKKLKRSKSINITDLRHQISSSSPYPSPSTTTGTTNIKSVTFKNKNESSIANTDDHSLWPDKFAPHSLTGVSVHMRKINEVKQHLLSMINGTSQLRLLILTGPSGAGKSTLVRCLAHELLPSPTYSEPLLEWENPSTISNTTYSSFNGFSSHITAFSDFLKSVKYKQRENLSVVLIEELPLVFHEPTRDSFRNAIFDYLHYESLVPLPPLVLCITELNYDHTGNGNNSGGSNMDINNNYSVTTILGHKILRESDLGRIHQIKFNEINKTLMLKTLRKIVADQPSGNKELFKKIPTVEVNQYLGSLLKMGDIRSAILSLQFWATWKGIMSGSDINFKDSQRQSNSGINSKIDGTFLSFGKESQMELFHSIGRIIFGSQKVDPAELLINSHDRHTYNELNFLSDDASKQSLLEVRTIPKPSLFSKVEANIKIAKNYYLSNHLIAKNSFMMSNIKFVGLFILENYAIFQKAKFAIVKAMCILNDVSSTDVMLTGGNNNGMRTSEAMVELAFQVLVRSARTNLTANDQDNQFAYLIEGAEMTNGSFKDAATAKMFGESNGDGGSGSNAGHDRLVFPRDFKALKKQRQITAEVNFYRFAKLASGTATILTMKGKGTNNYMIKSKDNTSEIKAQTAASSLLVSFNDANLLHGFYEPYINKQKQYLLKSYSSYLAYDAQNSNSNVSDKIMRKLNNLRNWQTQKNLLMQRLGGAIETSATDTKGTNSDNATKAEVSKDAGILAAEKAASLASLLDIAGGIGSSIANDTSSGSEGFRELYMNFIGAGSAFRGGFESFGGRRKVGYVSNSSSGSGNGKADFDEDSDEDDGEFDDDPIINSDIEGVNEGMTEIFSSFDDDELMGSGGDVYGSKGENGYNGKDNGEPVVDENGVRDEDEILSDSDLDHF